MANGASQQNERQLRFLAVEQHMEELWHYRDVPRIAAACTFDLARASSDEERSCESGAGNGEILRFASSSDVGDSRDEVAASSCSAVEPKETAVLVRGGASEESEMRRVFEIIDADGDGRISAIELVGFLEKLSLSLASERAHAVLNSADENGDGVLEYAEFVKLYASLCSSGGETDEAERDQGLRDAFTVFDSNNDGHISPSELQFVVQNLDLRKGRPARDFLAMINAVDKDGDGLVNFEEFKAMMLDVSSSRRAWSFAEFLRTATRWNL